MKTLNLKQQKHLIVHVPASYHLSHGINIPVLPSPKRNKTLKKASAKRHPSGWIIKMFSLYLETVDQLDGWQLQVFSSLMLFLKSFWFLWNWIYMFFWNTLKEWIPLHSIHICFFSVEYVEGNLRVPEPLTKVHIRRKIRIAQNSNAPRPFNWMCRQNLPLDYLWRLRKGWCLFGANNYPYVQRKCINTYKYILYILCWSYP